MMNEITIEGTRASAIVYAHELEDLCRAQIRNVCNHPAFEGSCIRIMPDVHSGAGCVIGFTARLMNDCVIPNLIGVDIGCGVLTVALPEDFPLDYEALATLDKRIRREIPHGFGVRDTIMPCLAEEQEQLMEEMKRISMDVLKGNLTRHYSSLGTLGGGNHFIEISRNEDDGTAYLHIHSGSRNFGHGIASKYQSIAESLCTEDVPRDLKYLTGSHSEAYQRDMRVAQKFAAVNRMLMARVILETDHVDEYFDTIHNYISPDDGIIRKGSVSAHEGELLLVPLNMRDGSLLCRGKGNEEYNCSAPHGAGRKYSRTQAKKVLDLSDFEYSMKDVYTTSVSKDTLDEAPMAYKPSESISEFLHPTAEIIGRLRPLYNFKAP